MQPKTRSAENVQARLRAAQHAQAGAAEGHVQVSKTEQELLLYMNESEEALRMACWDFGGQVVGGAESGRKREERGEP